MKITNISNVVLYFVIKNKAGISESIDLKPGKSVSTINSIVGKKLLVYERKKLILIESEDSVTTANPSNVEIPKEVIDIQAIDIQAIENQTQESVKRRGRPVGTTKPKPESNEPKKPRGRPVGTTKKDVNSFDIAAENAEKYINGEKENDI